MIIITSLSPFHINRSIQLESVRSWQKFGKCFSMNINSEIDQMYLIYKDEITFIKTLKSVKPLFGKNLISINAMIDFALETGNDLLLVNSDIVIDNLPDLAQDGITIFSRYDFIDHYGDAKIFDPGFDIFYLPYKFLNIFPPTIYAMGFCHWDHSIPYRALVTGVPVYWPQGKHAYHKIHPTQYSIRDWERTGEFFKWEFNFPKHLSIGQIATAALKEIKDNAIKI